MVPGEQPSKGCLLCTFAPQPSTSLLRERKRALAGANLRAIPVSAASQILTSSASCTALHCQTETDWGASVCTPKHANLTFSLHLRPPPLELCDFYSGSVVPKLDLVWRRIFIASGCEAVAAPPCRAPHCLQQARPDEEVGGTSKGPLDA